MNEKEIASKFISTAICEFFDTDEDKIASVQAVLDAAGFDAIATCWPVFGGIWPKKCEGNEAEEATKWLKALTDNLVRGKFEHEVEQVRDAIVKHKDI